MSKYVDQQYLQTDQYRDASNLDARIQLHRRFSTNKYGWGRWVFDQFHLPAECEILELGCGPGDLWLQNKERVLEGWEITLSDLTPGMVRDARRNLSASSHPFRYQVSDAQFIPCTDESFDVVIANHMLYHVPHREQALVEMRRVLRPGGRLYASTVGRTHLRELSELVRRFDSRARLWGGVPDESFFLENGGEQIARWFSEVVLRRYEDALVITEAEPLVAYVASTISMSDYVRDRLEEFVRFVERELALHGIIHVTKDSGMFEAFKGSSGLPVGC